MAVDLTKKFAYLLAEFTYHTSAVRYTDYTSDVTDVAGNTYTSTPSMAIVDLPAVGGALEARPLKLELPSNAFTSALANGEPHAPVTVVLRAAIKEFSIDSKAATATDRELVLFRGRVVRGVRNLNGRTDSIRLEAIATKGRLAIPLGIAATPTCRWPFAGEICGVDTSAFQQSTTVDAIDGARITAGAAFTDHGDATLYHRGYVERNGLRIHVRHYDGNVNTRHLYLAERVPAAWLSQTVTVHPGCDHTAATCDARWSNIARFGGMGVAIPNYHPVHEVP
jgi:hypothetical protein